MSAPNAHGRNPVLPAGLHIPDPEARVMPDGRVYVYGSWDRRDDFFCSQQYRVVSSADLRQWTDHGQSFDAGQVPWLNQPDAQRYPGFDWSRPTPFIQRLIASAPPGEFKIPQVPKDLLFAPDAIHHQGRYYLYFCASDQSEGVAVADNPAGPFHSAVQLKCGGIDPAVFIDDDGQGYFYWGQFEARGARLDASLMALQPGSEVAGLLTEASHHFHEGSSLRKRGSTYYLVYTSIERGQPTSLAYATASQPLGPFTHRGVIIDNADCDPKSWNNHGSIECVGGQWFVFYHRSSRHGQQYRRLCIEPIHFDDQGLIAEVPMTSQGPGAPFGLGDAIEGWRACALQGGCWIAPDDHGQEVLQGLQTGCQASWRWLQTDRPADGLQVQARGSAELLLHTATQQAVGRLRLHDGVVTEASLSLPAGHHELRLQVLQASGLQLQSLTLSAGRV
jgi:arabinoxylan arabinofuranohydrolase